MKKITYFFLFFIVLNSYANESYFFMGDETSDTYSSTNPKKKTTTIEKTRSFDNLNSKYTGQEFKYIEEKKVEPKNMDFSFFVKVLNFFTKILPYLFGLLVIFIIVKLIMGNDIIFSRFRRKKAPQFSEMQEDLVDVENIDSNDFMYLINLALKNNNYRLATRYYYLLSIQKLTEKKVINYHKDKTNIEYQYEIKNTEMSSAFGYILYLYNYVWYGEFELDSNKFKQTERSFKNFIKSV